MLAKLLSSHDASRLPEIYRLHVIAWEHSNLAAFVNQNLYPNGWSDVLDETANHYIVKLEETIVAAARVSELNDVEQVGDGFCQFILPTSRPFALYSRMVVHPGHRGRGYGTMINELVKKLFERSQWSFMLGVCGDEKVLAQYLQMGFTILGEGSHPYGPSTYIILNRPSPLGDKSSSNQ